MSKILNFDFLVIGSGIAGLTTALRLSERGSVAVVTRREVDEANTKYAQGGVACVLDHSDTFEEHVADTLDAGAGLCDEEAVRTIVGNGPAAIRHIIELGAVFTTRGDMGDAAHKNEFHLGREGGHKKRRVIHAGDITGEELERTLVAACRAKQAIEIFEHHVAIDLITARRLGWLGEDHALGAYVLDVASNAVSTFISVCTVVAAGGAGKVYLYSSNPDVSCGGGVAMCYRAHVPIANMEFYQFHPTILHHEKERSFLISEAVRGEGAVLKRYDANGDLREFMDGYHELASLAPRDIVARAIDNELKKTGRECAYLDIRHQSEGFLRKRFPNIFDKCLEAGFNMAEAVIPVVPAAHYCCGGVKTDVRGYTGIPGLYAIGENACTGFHGANRLASNSLLEAMVVAELAADDMDARNADIKRGRPTGTIPAWSSGDATDSDELVVITHNWEEIRQFMWDYVGIVRTDKRLERAKTRIKNIRKEIEKYYWDFIVTPDLIELRNITSVAEIIIDSAISRKESRGLHFNLDYPNTDPSLGCVDTIITSKH
ncbi:MAG: L-aspartate oxidase [Kiritimatiellaeota bacterium]|nr:L-aspartate oxidase [Kiritimatiellota bacterium]